MIDGLGEQSGPPNPCESCTCIDGGDVTLGTSILVKAGLPQAECEFVECRKGAENAVRNAAGGKGANEKGGLYRAARPKARIGNVRRNNQRCSERTNVGII